MKKVVGAILAAALVAACAVCVIGCGENNAAKDKTYKIATDTAFAPFDYKDKDGKLIGIDIDILDAIAQDQGFKYDLDALGFDAALQAVQSGQDEGVIAGMSITEERKQKFDFSDPYYDSTVCCAAPAGGNITKLEDLKGQKVATKIGTMSEKWANSIASQYGFTTTSFETSDVMYQDVQAGNSAACFEDTPVMAYAISTGNVKFSIVSEVDSKSEFATPYGFGVKKGSNSDLIEKFNKGLENIKKNGKFDEIVNKYLKA